MGVVPDLAAILAAIYLRAIIHVLGAIALAVILIALIALYV
jgi:hypothetical protein